MKTLFPIILIVLDFCAAIVYGYYGDWRYFTYWCAAGVLTVCVTL